MIAAAAAASRPQEAHARRVLAAGGILLLLGLALVGIGPSDLGMVVTLIALVVTIYGIHTFGRLGPEEAPAPAPGERPRKKKKKKKKRKRPEEAAPEAGAEAE